MAQRRVIFILALSGCGSRTCRLEHGMVADSFKRSYICLNVCHNLHGMAVVADSHCTGTRKDRDRDWYQE